MRILFFADNFKPETNAPATHIYERCRYWASWGHDVTVITCQPNFPEGKVFPGYKNRWRSVEMIDGIRVVRVWSYITANEGFLRRTLDYLSYGPPALWQSWFEERPDVIISSSPQLFTVLPAVASGWLRGVPHVFEVRDLWPASILATSAMKPGRLYNLLEQLELFLYAQSRRIISFTHSFVPELTRRGVPPEKIDVVINGASLDLFHPQPSRDTELEARHRLAGRFVVGYLGTWGLAHDLENVVAAAEQLRDQPVTFLLVGGGAAREKLEQLVADKGLTNVLLIPRVSKAELTRYWSLCDASLVHLKDDPVFSTVIPSKIFESMAVGLPILYVGPPGEGDKIVLEHQAGLALPPARPAELAAAVQRLKNAPEWRRELAKNSERAAPNFSRERQARKTLNVLRRALGERISLEENC
ncbi:MAG: glycosyltransferase family 4 protein [Pirellulales bacterium]|nr:glycosyltransferase family 4 protein [Pirellulales bacterium]